MHHPSANIERLFANGENSGSDLLQQELTYKTTTIGLKKYLHIATDWILVNTHVTQKKTQ